MLTWSMLGTRGLVQYEPVALGFTVVPKRLDRLLSQRSRWARGMLEGLRTHPPPKQPRVLAKKLVAGIDSTCILALDIGVIFFWVPGVILFLFGYPLIFGWWSMLLLPYHARRLRLLAAVASTPRVPHSRHPPAARQARLRRVPVCLPGAYLRCRAAWLRPVPRRVGSSLEVVARRAKRSRPNRGAPPLPPRCSWTVACWRCLAVGQARVSSCEIVVRPGRATRRPRSARPGRG